MSLIWQGWIDNKGPQTVKQGGKEHFESNRDTHDEGSEPANAV